jgi:hypothetical protein
MTFLKIKKISGNDEELLKCLSFGYLRSLDEDQLIELLFQYQYQNPYFDWIFRCYLELENCKKVEIISDHFMIEFERQVGYKKRRTIGSFLNQLYYKCNRHYKIKIINKFLSSGKRYLRKYAYQKPINKFSLKVLNSTYEILLIHPEEISFFAHAVAYEYDDPIFVENNIYNLINFFEIEEYLLRRLFLIKPNLSKDDWRWLKSKCPNSFLYLAAKRGYHISDKDCIKICAPIIKANYENSKIFSLPDIPSYTLPSIELPDNNLIYWCLAKLGKWKVINDLIIINADHDLN